MSDLLFKLTKDGKCVGHLRWNEGEWQFGWTEADEWVRAFLIGNKVGGIDSESILADFDSIYQFVCKDRQGQPVFEGDRVRKNRHICTVEWDDLQLRWMLREAKGDLVIDGEPYRRAMGFLSKEIELVEAPHARHRRPAQAAGRREGTGRTVF